MLCLLGLRAPPGHIVQRARGPCDKPIERVLNGEYWLDGTCLVSAVAHSPYNKEKAMSAIRLTVLLLTLVAANGMFVTSNAWAQQKYTISRSPSSNSQYLQEHAIDVDDRAGHQVRVYEIRYDYPEKDLAFAGVIVKQSLTRGMSDYINWSGPYSTYTVYSLEDGNKVFSRSAGATQTGPDGTRKFTFIENFVGGTGKFKGMRGQVRGSGERAAGAKSLLQQSSGEYWIEE